MNSIKIKKKSNICIFSHYDPDGLVDSYVVHYLQELTKCHCDIIFVTTSHKLAQEQINKISPYCKKNYHIKITSEWILIHFKCGLNYIDNLIEYDKLILANDSVYGPFYDLEKLFNYGVVKGLDIWGATDSWAHKYHIQSYFIVFF